ncbi:hypothetical protein KPL74_08680 [Bacillus sp. NP157]|nr:hypothetical protein KPL74_08680 [Bacillus sp. NP157]
MPAVLFRLASAIERDSSRVESWYTDDPIDALGCRTAQAVVAGGQLVLVLDFLKAVQQRDGL